ncbi:hypothetical protein B484DRAFT_465359 [Ochromonadaceae sp. CCMP2298]|nr:hypothetical protein B484DRAFT_465359 [Ochromonadaceae sp. CCMP2298]
MLRDEVESFDDYHASSGLGKDDDDIREPVQVPPKANHVFKSLSTLFPAPPPPKKQRRAMMTTAQLSAMFSRLDKNGDGELDLEEFTGIIKMLNIDVSHEYIAQVFHSVSQPGDNWKTLHLAKFISAYQLIYSGAAVDDSSSTTAVKAGFVRATRYGRLANGTFVLESYSFPSDGKAEKNVVRDLPGADTQYAKIDNEALMKRLSRSSTEPFAGTLDDIIPMIKADGHSNSSSDAKILWWIDASYAEVNRAVAEELVAKFGLPNNSSFLSSFGNFSRALGHDSKTRMFAGMDHYSQGTVSSLSFFASSIWLRNQPLVHHLPRWLTSAFCSCATRKNLLSHALRGVEYYYSTRFAWMFNFSWMTKNAATERFNAYERAAVLAEFIRDGGETEEGVQAQETFEARESVSFRKAIKGSLFSSKGGMIPLPRVPRTHTPAVWLLSNSRLYKTPPRLQIDSMSFHLLDQGWGAHTLLTVRKIDDEKHKGLDFEQKSRCGVLGRIVSGVWLRLAQVIMMGGAAPANAELTDGPASLVTLLILIMHNFSIDSSADVETWLRILEKEIKDVVVSKHSAHLAEVNRVLDDLSAYVDPILTLMQELSSQQREELQREFDAALQADDHPSPKPEFSRSNSLPRARNAFREELGLRESIEKVNITYPTICSFLDPDPYRELRSALDGYELLEIKGLTYWKDRLLVYTAKAGALQALIATQLDEKRNFTSFTLTIITTVLAPFAILTSYFGMNFENMLELREDTYPTMPGIKFMWVISGLAYGLLLLIVLHFRILYSAT